MRGFFFSREYFYMKLIKVSPSYYQLLYANKLDGEIVHNELGRPCILILRLKYNGRPHDFAVPLRSNISPKAPPDEFIALPPNSKTKPTFHHGIHIIKMFPIDRTQCQKFLTDGDEFFEMIKGIIQKREPEIIERCQKYLDKYAAGDRHQFSPDIDGIISLLEKNK